MKKYIFVVCLVLLAACASKEKRNGVVTEPETSISQNRESSEYSSNVFIRRYQQMLDARKQSTGKEPNWIEENESVYLYAGLNFSFN